MREMIERRGGKLPTPLRQPGLINETVDLDAVARDEQNEMQGYHGLDIDDASGMKMFCELSAHHHQSGGVRCSYRC